MRAKLKPQKKVCGQTEEPRRQWSDATINRHFSFLRHILMLAVKDGKLARNPVSGVSFLPEERRTRFLNDTELATLETIMAPAHTGSSWYSPWKPACGGKNNSASAGTR